MAIHQQLYIVDVYRQPEGYSEPVVKDQYRLTARNDAEAIRAAKAAFKGHDAPSVTGYTVRSIGFRRFGDQVIYRKAKAARPRR